MEEALIQWEKLKTCPIRRGSHSQGQAYMKNFLMEEEDLEEIIQSSRPVLLGEVHTHKARPI